LASGSRAARSSVSAVGSTAAEARLSGNSKTPAPNRQEWVARCLRRHPEVAALRERVWPLERAVGLARQYADVAGESAEALRQSEDGRTLLALIMQHLSYEGLTLSSQVLHEETATPYNTQSAQSSRLLDLLRLVLADTHRLWDLAMAERPLAPETRDTHTEDVLTRLGLLDERDDSADQNIWESGLTLSEAMEGRPEAVRAGTFNQLVTRLTSAKATDISFLKTFLMTYQSFATPRKLLIKLIQRYQVPAQSSFARDPQGAAMSADDWRLRVVMPIQMRVTNVLKQWIKEYFHDFQRRPKLLQMLHHFVDHTLPDSGQPSLARSLSRTLEAQLATLGGASAAGVAGQPGAAGIGDSSGSALQRRQGSAIGVGGADGSQTARGGSAGGGVGGGMLTSSPSSVFLREAPEPKVPRNIFSPTLRLTQVDEEEVARQLTLLDSELYRCIRPAELLNQSWAHPHLQHRSPNLCAFIRRFNSVSTWVISAILRPERARQRARAMTRFIRIAEHCLALNNFHTLMAILGALTSAPVHRLRHTKAEMERSTLAKVREFSDLMRSDSSFAAYRNKLSGISPPAIPYIGVFLKDLVFIEDGNPDVVQDGLINFSKRTLLYSVIQRLQQFQMEEYNLQSVYQIAELLKLSTVVNTDEGEMFHLSLLREPRNATSVP